jgi:Rrf2 family protein
MRISTRGRYSLEALLHLTLQGGTNDDFASTRTISEATGVSERYLEQLFIPLREGGVIQGIRGPRGGYRLGKPPADVTVGAVLRIVEGPMELVECVAEAACPMGKACASHNTWSELYRAITGFVDTTTLADLAASYRSMNTEYSI